MTYEAFYLPDAEDHVCATIVKRLAESKRETVVAAFLCPKEIRAVKISVLARPQRISPGLGLQRDRALLCATL